MAYLQAINDQCAEYGCKSRAKLQLIDRWNGKRGQYCKRHADAALKRQKQNEQPDQITEASCNG